MVTKLKKSSSSSSSTSTQATSPNMSQSVRDSAQQIWQAGLGAFAKAQAEGTRAFEALVKEGTALQRKTQAAAEDRITEATSRMTTMANDLSSRASGHWDKLESIFEERVAKALNRLGVPSAKDISALIARVDALNDSVQALMSAKAGSAPAKAARTAGTRQAPARAAEVVEAASGADKARSPTPPRRPRKAAAGAAAGAAAVVPRKRRSTTTPDA